MILTIEAAIKYLYAKYKQAQTLEYIRNPLAWALYETWKWVDSKSSK